MESEKFRHKSFMNDQTVLPQELRPKSSATRDHEIQKAPPQELHKLPTSFATIVYKIQPDPPQELHNFGLHEP
eukprot:5875472-Heterocapsa_arctica.AAC.1